MAKLKTEQEQTEMADALKDAKTELQDLADEMGNWRDNMSGTSLENTEKYETVSECADTLEDLASRLDDIELPEEHETIPVTYNWVHPYGRNIGRSWRASKVASLLRAMIDELPEGNEIDGDIEDIAGELDNLEFPGMY